MKQGLAIFGFLILCGGIMMGARLNPSDAAAHEAVAPTQIETRCGWFDNPTPANIWLYDRDAEWTIGVQGGYQVENDWEWPDFKRGQFVETNGSYGYGCVCMQMSVNRETHQVVEIKSAKARPLASCRRDPALKKWRSQFK